MKFWEFDDKSCIADYNEGDFREYWTGRSKELLHNSECRILAELLPPQQGWFVDIGAGFGRLVPRYTAPDRKIVLVDYAMNHLEMAAKEYADLDLHYIAADAYNLPFRNEVFSSGVCIRLFHHIVRATPFLEEVSRVFRRRSHIVMTYMNRRSLLRVFRYGLSSLERTHEEMSPQLFGTHPAYFAQAAAVAGLRVKRTQGTGLVHQITHEIKFIEDFIDRNPTAFGAARIAERVSDKSLGGLRLALMQYALLEKENGDDGLPDPPETNSTLLDILMCPSCHSSSLEAVEEGLVCQDCEKMYPKQGEVYDFRCI